MVRKRADGASRRPGGREEKLVNFDREISD